MNKKLMGLVVVFGVVLMLSACNSDNSGNTNNNNNSSTACVVGTQGPAGGYVFFCDDPNNKVLASDKVGLEAAPSDLDTTYIWSDVVDAAAGTLRGIGTGAANTQAIITQSPTADTAAKACGDLVVGAFSDFFLPSMSELNTMYVNLRMKDLGSFTDNSYWSSSESDSTLDSAWNQELGSGQTGLDGKINVGSIRCARAF